MENKIDLLSNNSNCPVIHVAGRKFPGIALQGDSLRNLQLLAGDIKKRSKALDDAELHELSQEMENILTGYLQIYEKTMRQFGLELPYLPSK